MLAPQFDQKLLGRLKAAKAAHAIDALQRPSQRDAFEYGYRCGVQAGYDAAIEQLLQLLRDEETAGRDL